MYEFITYMGERIERKRLFSKDYILPLLRNGGPISRLWRTCAVIMPKSMASVPCLKTEMNGDITLCLD